MMKPPIVRPQVDEPTIIKVEYYEIVLPDGTLLVQRDGRNIRYSFDDLQQAQRALSLYLTSEHGKQVRQEQADKRKQERIEAGL